MWHKLPMRYCVLGSGSNGNSCYIEHGSTRVLLDVGLGPVILTRRLKPLGVSLKDITHVLLTHEHWDHTKGLPGVLRRNPEVQVMSTAGTFTRLGRLKLKKDFNRKHLNKSGKKSLGDITVHSFSTSHDSADSVGYRLESTHGTLGFATDLGVFNDKIVDFLRGVTGLVIEANHCSQLLNSGPYPFYLKRRVGGVDGHLSNSQCRDLLERVLHDDLVHLTMAHLSDTNNTPEAIWETLSPLYSGPAPPNNWSLGSRYGPLDPVDLSPQLSFDSLL